MFKLLLISFFALILSACNLFSVENKAPVPNPVAPGQVMPEADPTKLEENINPEALPEADPTLIEDINPEVLPEADPTKLEDMNPEVLPETDPTLIEDTNLEILPEADPTTEADSASASSDLDAAVTPESSPVAEEAPTQQ